MSKTIAVPDELYNRAARAHVSVEEFVSGILANRIANSEFIETRARLFNREEFNRALDQIPDTEP